MAKLKLTKTTVEAVTPEKSDVFLWDSLVPRFGVKITPSGSRIYLVQYRAKAAPGQKSVIRRVTIGKHGELWTVEKARGEAKTLLAAADLQRDPFEERRTERHDKAMAEIASIAEAEERARADAIRERDEFSKVADRYIELRLGQNKSGDESARLIKYDAVPTWTGRHISEIRRADVADLIDGIRSRSPAVARATYAALRGLFSWCVERDLIQHSPCEGMKAPPRVTARDRVLSDDELLTVWRGCTALGFPFGTAHKILMLTGQRRSEVSEMEWSELDLDAAIWRIPKERTKNGKAHEVDLCPLAVTILKEIPEISEFVFPARGGGGVQGFSAAKRQLDETIAKDMKRAAPDASMAPWVTHDLRRTCATGMASMNFPPHVVERVLNHISGTQSGLVGVYQRHEYRDERRAALLAWGAHVEAIATGKRPASNIVAITSRSK
jgi:integrase